VPEPAGRQVTQHFRHTQTALYQHWEAYGGPAQISSPGRTRKSTETATAGHIKQEIRGFMRLRLNL